MLVLFSAVTGRGAEFVNLGFDDPDLSHVEFSIGRGVHVGPANEVLRGWTINPPAAQWPDSGRISVDGGSPPFGLTPSVDPQSLAWYGRYHLDVNVYDEFIFGGGMPLRPTLTLSQVGRVPVDAAWLKVWEGGGYFGPLEAYIDGRPGVLTPPPIPTGSGVTFLDVSAVAGQEAELKFVFPAGTLHDFDIIGFVPVPEPSSWALLAVGAAWLAGARRRRWC